MGYVRHPTAAFFTLPLWSISWDSVLRPGGYFCIEFGIISGAQRGTLDPSEVCNYKRFHALGPQSPASVFGPPSGGGPGSVFLDFGSATGSHLDPRETLGSLFFGVLFRNPVRSVFLPIFMKKTTWPTAPGHPPHTPNHLLEVGQGMNSSFGYASFRDM